MRTGSLKIWSSVMPAQVFRRAAVGEEFMARAVTSAMVSQQLEERPKEKKGISYIEWLG